MHPPSPIAPGRIGLAVTDGGAARVEFGAEAALSSMR